MDLDSIVAYLEPQYLRKLMGVKAHLGSTKFRMHGDPESEVMMMISDHPALFVDPVWGSTISAELQKEGIVFEPSQNNLHIAEKGVTLGS